MEQLDLFETGELVQIREFLHVWNEAQREAVRNKKPTEQRGKARQLPSGRK